MSNQEVRKNKYPEFFKEIIKLLDKEKQNQLQSFISTLNVKIALFDLKLNLFWYRLGILY